MLGVELPDWCFRHDSSSVLCSTGAGSPGGGVGHRPGGSKCRREGARSPSSVYGLCLPRRLWDLVASHRSDFGNRQQAPSVKICVSRPDEPELRETVHSFFQRLVSEWERESSFVYIVVNILIIQFFPKTLSSLGLPCQGHPAWSRRSPRFVAGRMWWAGTGPPIRVPPPRCQLPVALGLVVGSDGGRLHRFPPRLLQQPLLLLS